MNYGPPRVPLGLYNTPDAKLSDTLGVLVERADRAVRARQMALEQAQADYELLPNCA